MIENPLREAEQGIFQEQSQGNPTPFCTIFRVPFKKWIKKKKKKKRNGWRKCPECPDGPLLWPGVQSLVWELRYHKLCGTA